MAFVPTIEHDPESDAVYVCLAEGDVHRSGELDDFRHIDYSEDGRVIGIEFLAVSGGIDLNDIPFRKTVEKLIQPIFA